MRAHVSIIGAGLVGRTSNAFVSTHAIRHARCTASSRYPADAVIRLPHLIPHAVMPAVIAYDPKKWIRLLLDVPRSRVLNAPSVRAHRERNIDLLGEFPRALARHLNRPGGVSEAQAPGVLLPTLHRAVHSDISTRHLVTDARLTLVPLRQQIDAVMGGCERIRNTPIPISYSTYVKQFVLVYALVMPFGLVEDFGYGAVLASMLTFFATMGLKLLAGEIESPFGNDANDLPLDQITATIVRDVHPTLGVRVAPSAPTAR